MSLRIDLEDAIRNLRLTLENLGNDLQRLEGLVENHFVLEPPPEPVRKVPAKVFENLEKEIKAISK